jgi:hypothetical protein
MEKQSIKRGPKRMTEKQLAANRRNASMGGRPLMAGHPADRTVIGAAFQASKVVGPAYG